MASTEVRPEASEVVEPGAELLRIEATESLRVALEQLPQEQREPLRMAFLDGLTHEQIARDLGQPLGTVKTRIRLALMRLPERYRSAEDGQMKS